MPDDHDVTAVPGDGAAAAAAAPDGQHDGHAAHPKGPLPIGSLAVDAPQFQIAAKHPRRAEMAAAAMFLLAMAGYAGFGAAYWVNARSELLGLTIGIGMGATGVAFVIWGKYLMPKGPFMEERHTMVPTPEEKARIVNDFASRGKIAIERRSFLVKLLGGAVGILSVVAAFPLLRSLGPLPGDTLYHTKWRKGIRAVTIEGAPVNIADMDVGGVLTVFPADDVGSAVSQTILVRASTQPIATRPGRESWGPDGYLAYSKVCTHAGCPVSLYQEDTEQLLCPCHQSLFNILEGAEPVFGPAPRPLPQLPLAVDAEGFLVAQGDFDQPIGPGFWERS
jgi:ubiquinol-cytochrome c reductase iron-sulfur subunit